MVEFIPAKELSVTTLTRKERDWIRRLAKCLDACPDRLELLTDGDCLKVVDKEGARRSELANGAATDDGVQVATLPGPICHGVS